MREVESWLLKIEVGTPLNVNFSMFYFVNKLQFLVIFCIIRVDPMMPPMEQQASRPSTPLTWTVGCQTMYRDSEAQTGTTNSKIAQRCPKNIEFNNEP